MTPSLCGSFLRDKKSLIAFTWTICTVLTLLSFLVAIVLTCQVHTHYKRMERYYESQYEAYRYNNNNRGEKEDEGEGENREGEMDEGGSQDSADRMIQAQLLLSAMTSKSMTFVALYTMAMAVALSLVGSTAIIGFTSLRGDYIAPCFSSTSGSPKLRLGIFGGAIVIFANLLLVCAVVFGEVRVEDWSDMQEEEERENRAEMEPYEVERVAAILAVSCMFLSALYTVFSVLLFLFFGSEEYDDDQNTKGSNKQPLVMLSNDPRRDDFITMEDNST